MARLEYCPWCMAKLEGLNPCPSCGRDVNAYLPAPWHIVAGSVLSSRYVVGGVLREDALAVTYLGFDQVLRKRVDIREQRRFQGAPAGAGRADGRDVHALTWGGDAGRQAFLAEARQVARFGGSDALPAVVDLFVEGDSAFVVVDHAEGETLLEIVRNRGRAYAFDELRLVLRPVFRSLASLHASRIAYGVIEPDGIVVTPSANLLVRWPKGTHEAGEHPVDATAGARREDVDAHGPSTRTDSVRPDARMDARTVAVRPLPSGAREVRTGTETSPESEAVGAPAHELPVTVRPSLAPTVAPAAFEARGAARPFDASPASAFAPTEDVTSLCATAYYLLIGVDPGTAAANGGLVCPSELGVAMPREAEEALMRALGGDVPALGELADAWYGAGGLEGTTVTRAATGAAATGPGGNGPAGDVAKTVAPAMEPAAHAGGNGGNKVLVAIAAVIVAAIVAVAVILLKPAGTGGLGGPGTVADAGSPEAVSHEPSVSIGMDNVVLTRSDKTVWVMGGDLYGQRDAESWSGVERSVAGGYHVLGLKGDGTVVASGRDYEGQCEVDGWESVTAIDAGMLHSVALLEDGTVRAMGGSGAGQCAVSGWSDLTAVSCGLYHTVGLTSEGTVVACGAHEAGQCDVEGWEDITQVDAGYLHTAGLRSDGTCVAVGNDDFGQTDVEGWEDVVSIAVGAHHTVGLTRDGTVLACGNDDYGQCDVDRWKGVSRLYAGGFCTVALLGDGTYVACGLDAAGLLDIAGTGVDGLTPAEIEGRALEVPEIGDVNCEVVSAKTYTARIAGGTVEFKGKVPADIDTDDWSDVVSIVEGGTHLVGLRSDGTVVATGDNDHGQCDVSGWSDVAVVLAAADRTVALREDGTVVACGDNGDGACDVSTWSDVRAISVSDGHTVGLRSDGTVLACGANEQGQCDVSGWSDVVDLSCGARHTVGLRSDGTVVACGENDEGQLDVDAWDEVAAISAGRRHTLGLRSDGTVLACGANDFGQCDVSGWSDVKAVESSDAVDVTYALAKGGVALATGDDRLGQCGIAGSEDLVGLYFGERHVVGRHMYLDYEAAGDDEFGQCDLASWNGRE